MSIVKVVHKSDIVFILRKHL